MKINLPLTFIERFTDIHYMELDDIISLLKEWEEMTPEQFLTRDNSDLVGYDPIVSEIYDYLARGQRDLLNTPPCDRADNQHVSQPSERDFPKTRPTSPRDRADISDAIHRVSSDQVTPHDSASTPPRDRDFSKSRTTIRPSLRAP